MPKQLFLVIPMVLVALSQPALADWQNKLLSGQTVTVFFHNCGAGTMPSSVGHKSTIVCGHKYEITYPNGNCESAFGPTPKKPNGHSEGGHCNGNPTNMTFSIFGDVFSFNNGGEVLHEGLMVGKFE